MKDFLEGFLFPFRSLNLFFADPKFIAYSVIPVILNLLIYSTIFFFVYSNLIGVSERITEANLPDASFFQETIHILILIFFFMLLLILCYLLFTILGGLVSTPFNERISQIIEEKITNTKYITDTGFFKDAVISIKAEALKLMFYFSVIIPLFIIGFVPLIGAFVSAVLGFIFSCFFNALDFLDYPMTRKNFTLRKKIKVTFSGKGYTFGFGCISFLVMLIPIVNALLKPVFVVAGTALYFEKYSKKHIPATEFI